MTTSDESPGMRLRALMARPDKVLTVLGVPSARLGQIMDHSGCEMGFVGTSITFGNYTGLPDTGVASATECLTIGGHIARAVSFPAMLDGDTGHGGRDAVRRLVKDAIREGLAGLRLDDQPIEGKRRTQTPGISVIERDAAIERYATAVEAKNEVDPSFVVMAQCYARDATNGGLDEALARLKLYANEGGVDWVQLEAPHSIPEVEAARNEVDGFFSAMQGKLTRPLTIEEHKDLGLNAAWYTFLPGRFVLGEALRFMKDFREQGVRAWTNWLEAHQELLEELREL